MSNNCLLFFNARRRKIFFARRFVIRTYFLFEMRAFHTIRFLYHRKLTCATYVIVNLFRWNDVSRTSRIFCPKIAIFSVLSIFKCNPGKTNNESLFSNYFLVISIRWYIDELKKKKTNSCIRYGRSLWSANQLLVQEVKRTWTIFGSKLHYFLSYKYI